MSDAMDDFEARYHDLAVVTCEWRAFDMSDPTVSARLVFARLSKQKGGPNLKLFYKCVDAVIDQVYRDAAGKQSILNTLMVGATAMLQRPPKTPEERIRKAFVALSMRDVILLRQGYWDNLTPEEMAEVNGGTADAQRQHLEAALKHFAAHLPTDAGDPVTAIRSIQPGEHRWRVEFDASA